MKSLIRFLICALLALLSFFYARQHYVSKYSVTVSRTTFTNPFVDKSLLGDWIKEEWVFAIVVPVAFIVGGMVWSTRR